jgi:hypothetical protein
MNNAVLDILVSGAASINEVTSKVVLSSKSFLSLNVNIGQNYFAPQIT